MITDKPAEAAGTAPMAKAAGASRLRPLFVGGCERSGTTMLGAMVGGHSHCVCVPETQFLEDLLGRQGFDQDAVDPRKVLSSIVAHQRYRLLWNLPIDPRTVDPAEVGSTCAEVLSWLAREYGRRHGTPAASLWVDHTPSNFKRALTLLRMFPDGRFLHIVRDGRGVAASILPLDWGPNNILAAADYWMARCGAGLAAELELGSDRVMRVRYEELLVHPEITLRRIASFAGLEYEPAMADGSGHSPNRYNRRQHRLVGQPPDESRAHSWSQSLAPRQIEIFEYTAGEFLETLGYEREYGVHARAPRPSEIVRMKLGAFFRWLWNQLRKRRRIRMSLGRS